MAYIFTIHIIYNIDYEKKEWNGSYPSDTFYARDPFSFPFKDIPLRQYFSRQYQQSGFPYKGPSLILSASLAWKDLSRAFLSLSAPEGNISYGEIPLPSLFLRFCLSLSIFKIFANGRGRKRREERGTEQVGNTKALHRLIPLCLPGKGKTSATGKWKKREKGMHNRRKETEE